METLASRLGGEPSWERPLNRRLSCGGCREDPHTDRGRGWHPPGHQLVDRLQRVVDRKAVGEPGQTRTEKALTQPSSVNRTRKTSLVSSQTLW